MCATRAGPSPNGALGKAYIWCPLIPTPQSAPRHNSMMNQPEHHAQLSYLLLLLFISTLNAG